MAGLNVTPDQIAQARSAGYSDPEIVQHLQPKAPEQFDAALKAGYSPTEILQHLAPEQSGIADNFRQGVAESMQGVGHTLETYTGKGPVGTWLQEHGKASEPANFVPSPLVDESGVHPSNILRSLARSSPGAVAALAAAGAAPEALGAAGAVAAGTGVGALMSAGDAAKEAAVKRTGDPDAVPNAADKTRGGLTAVASSAVQSLPISRFLAPGAGAVVSNVIGNTGLKGVADVAKKALVSTGEQAAASGAANTVSQVGQSVGTPGGVTVNPTQVENAAATGGVMGGAFAAKRALPEALDAAKFSGITPELKLAATQFANRMVDANDGDVKSLQGTPVFSGTAQRLGEDSFTKAQAAVKGELNDAVSSLTTKLPTDAQNILHAAMTGKQPTPGDYATLRAGLSTDPMGPNVLNLVQQAHAGDIFGATGHHYDGKFTGSGAGALGHALTGEHITKTALVAAIGGEAGHLITFSPEMLAAAAGATVGKRLLDNITGAQAPAGRIVRNFADGQTPVRLNTPPPPVAPGAPVPAGPGVNPVLPGLPRPWSAPQTVAAINAAKRVVPPAAPAPVAPSRSPMAGGPGSPPMLPPAIVAQMKARAVLAQAAANNVQAPAPPPVVVPHGGPPMAGGPGTLPMLPPAVQAQMAARANLAKLGAQNASPPAAAVPASPAEPALNPLALPSSITGPAKAIMRGANSVQKQKADALGSEAARNEVSNSPFIAQKLNGAELPTPAAAKHMSVAAKGASILAKLQSDPAGDAEEAAQAKTDAAAAKAAAKPVKAAPDPAAVPAKGPIDLPDSFTASLKGTDNKPVSLGDMRAAVAPKEAPHITLSKANGQTKVNDDPFPPSSYGHLPAEFAARAITKAGVDAGVVKFPSGHRAGVQARIQGERNAMAQVGQAVPGLPIADLTARLEGRTDREDATAYREHLKTTFPQAAAALDKYLSDEAINNLWPRKKPPKKSQ